MVGRGGSGRGRGRSIAAPPSISNAAAASSSSVPAPIITVQGPPAIFPNCNMPEPIDPREESDLLAIRWGEEWIRYMQNSPYHLIGKGTTTSHSSPSKFDRYSDKYMVDQKGIDHKGRVLAINTCLSFFPEELHSVYNVEKAQKLARRCGAPSTKGGGGASFDETLAKLRSLEYRDQEEIVITTDGKGENQDNEEDDKDEVLYEEEELEDETDYNLNYFDNGEDYGDYDDGDEGPIY